MVEIICAGFGGQGVLTAGLIIARTGMTNDKNVTWIPSYGSEMRGGTANCHVKIGDKKIPSPFVTQADILMAMNTPSLEKFESLASQGALVVVNGSLVPADRKYRSDLKVIRVDATAIAEGCSNPKGANIVMLGAMAGSGVLFDNVTFSEGIDSFFEEKKKNNPLNMSCFNAGTEAMTVVQG